MDKKLVDVKIMGLHNSIKHLTTLEVDSNPPTTECRAQLPDATVKGLLFILTKRLNKYQQLQNLPIVNNPGRYFHRGR